MEAYILDDELHCSAILEKLIRQHCPQIKEITSFQFPDEALEKVKSSPPDILFLDVEMPYMTGFDFLKALGPIPSSVIFTTAYDTYAVQAFRVNAVDYLLKPVDRDDLRQAVEKIALRPASINENLLAGLIRSAMEHQIQPRKIALPTAEGIHLIPLDDIYYCKSEGAYSQICLREQANLLISKNLAEMEDMIQSPRFFRVHKSFLIHRDHILKVDKSDGGEVIMRNLDRIPISRQRKSEFLEWLTL
jgi:two-component system, LytTR family, response regulator